MALSLLINSVDVTSHWYLPGMETGQLQVERVPSGPGPASFKLYGLSGSTGYRPAVGQAIELKDGSTSLLKGVITDIDEEGLSDLDTGVITTVTVKDQQRLPGETTYTVTYSAGAWTLKGILQDLLAHTQLGTAGITLDGTQATGPTLTDELDYTDVYVEKILNDLQQLTGYVWRITPGLVLSMKNTATESSGLTLSDTAGTVQNKVSITQGRSQGYASRIIVKAGTGEQTISGEQILGDGSTRLFPLAFTAVSIIGTLELRGGSYATGGPYFEPWGIYGVDDMPWTFDAANNRFVQRSDQTVLASNEYVVVNYVAQFPFVVTAQDATVIAANGGVAVERIIAAPDVFDKTEAQDLANAALAEALAVPRTVTVQHRAGWAWPGQTVALSFTEHQISGTWMILSVEAQDDVDQTLIYTFTCLEGSTLQPTWIDYFKQLANGSGSASSTISSGVTLVSGSGIAGSGTSGNVAVWTASTTLGDASIASGTILGRTASGAGVVSALSTLPSAVQANITQLGTITSISGGLALNLLPDSTATRDIGSASTMWRQGFVSQLNAVLFAKETQTLYGGWLAVSKNAGTFPSGVPSSATTIDFGQSMTANQFVLIRAADTGGTIGEEYIQVGTLVSGTTYHVTRNLSGTGAKNWASGTPYQVRGVAGDGWIELNAFDTPRISIFQQGSAYNNSTEQIRVGYLTGMPNSSSGLGAYMGDSTNYFRWDGSALRLHSSGCIIDSSGITVSGSNSIYDTSGSYKFGRDTALGYGQSGDIFALYTIDGGAHQFLNLENTIKGTRIGLGGSPGDARVNMTAAGWDDTGSGANTTAASIGLRSDVGISDITLTANTISLTGSLVWTSYTPTLGVDTGSWTVGSGSLNCAYAKIGNLTIVQMDIENTTLSGSPTQLTATLPVIVASASQAELIPYFASATGGWLGDGLYQTIIASPSYMLLSRLPGTAFPNGTGFYVRRYIVYRS